MHATDRIADPPFPVQGAARVAGLEDRTLLMAWMVDFHREALGIEDARTAASVDDRLATGDLFVWERGGAPVSVVGLNGPVAGVVRIGPVYTPPALRGHGYASAAVAAASRAALTRGAHTCMLLTDLANPTSNKIYAALGYRRFGDWEEHELD
jgi:predicted GNAT family acetyltransferase